MSSSPPPGTTYWESPSTRKRILFFNENILVIREYYMNKNIIKSNERLLTDSQCNG